MMANCGGCAVYVYSLGHAAPSPRPRVGHDSDVLLNVDGVFAELLNCAKQKVRGFLITRSLKCFIM